MNNYDLIIIGAGPAGYEAAIKATEYGKSVLCIDKDALGGTCLNHGCIPTKTFVKSANLYRNLSNLEEYGVTCNDVKFDYQKILARTKFVSSRLSKGIEFLFKKHNISFKKGFAKILSEGKILFSNDEISEEITCEKIIIATGGSPKRIFKNISSEKIITSREALNLKELPKSIVILGAGAIGVEFAWIWNAFGVKVSIVEMRDEILPNEDEDVSKFLKRCLKKNGIDIFTGTYASNITESSNGLSINLLEGENEKILEAEKVLLALGVSGNTDCICKEITTENTFICVDQNLQTSVKNIYAIGDVIGPPLLAHVATFEGLSLIDSIYSNKKIKLQKFYPSCTYCSPEVASIGLTEKLAREKFINIKISKVPFLTNGKAVSMGETEGFIKLISNADSKEILGAHIIGSEATELIAEYTLAIHLNAHINELSNIVHAHPTLSEMFYSSIIQ